MNIANKLRAIPILITIMTVTGAAIAFLSFQNVQQKLAHDKNVTSIIVNVYMLEGLMHEYLLQHEDRPKVQWEIQNNALSRLLDRIPLEGQRNSHLLTEMKGDQAQITKLFHRLLSVVEEKGSGRGSKFAVEIGGQVQSQMALFSQDMIRRAVQLGTASHDDLLNLQKVTNWFLMGILAFFGLLIAALSFLVGRSVQIPVSELSHAAEVVGVGNLDFQISSDRNDELGRFSKTFDQMIAQLKTTLISRDALEEEVSKRNAELRIANTQLISELEEKKLREEELKQNKLLIQEQLDEISHLYDTAPVGLSFIDTDFRYVRINQRLAAINGRPESEHIGLTIKEVIRELALGIEPIYRNVVKTGKPALNLEIRGATPAEPDDKKVWLVSFFPLKGEDGRVKGVSTVVQDITERKHMEDELRSSDSRFRAFMDNNPAIIYIKEPSGSFIFGNKTLLEAVDMQLDEFIGITSDNFLAPEFAEIFDSGDKEVVSQQVTVTNEEWRGTFSGETRWWKECKFPVPSKMGQALVGGIAIDITDLKRAENKIKKQQKFDNLLTKLSAKFINLPFEQIMEKIDEGLKLITEQLGIDRIAFLQFSEDMAELELSHTYADLTEHRAPLFKVSERLPWYSETLKKGKTIRIFSLDEMPEKAVAERQYLKEQGIKSFITIPMNVDGSIIGAISYSSMTSEQTWESELEQRLNLSNELMASALSRSLKEQKLQNAFAEIKQLKDKLQKENTYLRQEVEVKSRHGKIVGKSQAIRQVMALVEKVAEQNSTVLILGETGTGKEVVAQAIHNMSDRKNRTMIKVNCAALPSSLIESEMFGRVKGAYTGALSRQTGRFEAADGSTLFLDEIGELPQNIQVKLLRVLQEGEFERLGSTETVKVDVRVIAATNQHLTEAMRSGKFRRDLYYRLNVFPITVPPLRDHCEDIPLLAWAFIREFENAMGKNIESIKEQTMDMLVNYSWPGNIRELKNVIERAMILNTDPVFCIRHIETEETVEQILRLEDVMNHHIRKTLEKTGWRVGGKNGAADILGLNRTTLLTKMKKLNIQRIK